tara:strand:+ start:2506 stop:2736 length:231 start_codon:yes stop_codon:yes gene_type:complete
MSLDSTVVFVVMGVVILLQTIGLGLVIGYLVRAYIHDVTPQYTHPEMFDENGNPIAESLISFRFEGDTPHLDEFED